MYKIVTTLTWTILELLIANNLKLNFNKVRRKLFYSAKKVLIKINIDFKIGKAVVKN